jgi:hypothetical protein
MDRERLSRRALLGAGVTLGLAAGQQQSSSEELKAAVDQQQSNYEQMKKIKLGFFLEPAPVFRP